ncbi:MAG: prepilin peptidase [Lachnospiraceae bacterium]|nr:prepilin peptidase [Lachnospiraceae bacterium]
MQTMLLFLIVLILGILIGSFINVCVYRIPKHENITTTRSHCMACGNVIKWYDLVPVISYLLLGGKCRNCKAKLSIQYPIIELLNGLLYCLIFAVMGLTLQSVLTMALTSALIVIAVIDWRTYEIPFGLNVFIAVLGILYTLLDLAKSCGMWVYSLEANSAKGAFFSWLPMTVSDHLIGAVSVSGFLLILYLATKGRGIGGGDIKLMAAAGLFLGWKNIILAFVIGCILGSVIHLIRMKVSKQDHVLAFGPYLAAGIFIASLWGNGIVNAYISTLTIN